VPLCARIRISRACHVEGCLTRWPKDDSTRSGNSVPCPCPSRTAEITLVVVELKLTFAGTVVAWSSSVPALFCPFPSSVKVKQLWPSAYRCPLQKNYPVPGHHQRPLAATLQCQVSAPSALTSSSFSYKSEVQLFSY
jgi:hypothetical protein